MNSRNGRFESEQSWRQLYLAALFELDPDGFRGELQLHNKPSANEPWRWPEPAAANQNRKHWGTRTLPWMS